jgi:cobyrinic acid a,c-diamide synthase
VIIEGVMGLFDGTDLPDLEEDSSAPGTSTSWGSTAHVARLTNLPVILVIDCAHLSQSAAAIALGYSSLDPDLRIAGVILNNIKSTTHEALIRQAMASIGLEVFGVIRNGELPTRHSRHLGLRTAEEDPAETRRWVDTLGEVIRTAVELEPMIARAERIVTQSPSLPAATQAPLSTRPVIAYSMGPAASFIYPENLDLLREAGGDVVGFDPLVASIPPKTGLIWLHGGYPEHYLDELCANQQLHVALRRAVDMGVPIIAECGGHLLLGQSLNGRPMVGVLPLESTISTKLSLGYRQVLIPQASPLSLANRPELPAHEFHYARSDEARSDEARSDEARSDKVRSNEAGQGLSLRTARRTWRAGFANQSMISSYLHWHLGADVDLAHSLVQRAASSIVDR